MDVLHIWVQQKSIGALLLEDPLHARGKSLIPTVASMLAELSPKKRARDWLPPLTILYMAPGGHRQWPVSIKPLLNRLSWIVLKTRPLALMHLSEALHDNPDWKPMYRQGPKVESVPAVPYKFLDIGTQMGEYRIEGLIPKRDDKNNILHPRHTRPGIPPVNTFHSIVQNRVGSGVARMHGLTLPQSTTFGLQMHPSVGGDCQFLLRRVQRSCSCKGRG